MNWLPGEDMSSILPCPQASPGGQHRRLGHVDLPPGLHSVQLYILGSLQARGYLADWQRGRICVKKTFQVCCD